LFPEQNLTSFVSAEGQTSTMLIFREQKINKLLREQINKKMAGFKRLAR
jgi:hypothetical protein